MGDGWGQDGVEPFDVDRVEPGDDAGGLAGAGDVPEPPSESAPLPDPDPVPDPDPLAGSDPLAGPPSDEPVEPDEPAVGVAAAGTVDSLAPEEDPPERLSGL